MTKTTLRLPKDLHKELKIRAIQQDREMQDVFEEAVRQYLARPAAKVSREK